MMPTMSAMPSAMPSMPAFFDGGMSMGGGMYYMTCTDKNPFGYYSLSFMPWLYHFDMGWEYFIDAGNSAHGGFMWDQKMGVSFYTEPDIFPFMYNFGKGAWYYYAPDPNMSGHYSTNPRWFYDFGANKWVSS